MDAATGRRPILVADLNLASELRWPAFTGAVLDDGIKGVFARPVMMASVCVGALDLFREGASPLQGDALAGGLLAAELAALPLLDLMSSTAVGDPPGDLEDEPWERLGERDRLEVYQATRFLIAELDVSPTEALVLLRAHAIASNQTASEVARGILNRRLTLDRDDRHRDDNHRDGDKGSRR